MLVKDIFFFMITTVLLLVTGLYIYFQIHLPSWAGSLWNSLALALFLLPLVIDKILISQRSLELVFTIIDFYPKLTHLQCIIVLVIAFLQWKKVQVYNVQRKCSMRTVLMSFEPLSYQFQGNLWTVAYEFFPSVAVGKCGIFL